MSKKLEHNALPNLDEVKRFTDGSLDPARAQEIGDIASENPLLKESLEGYAATGIFMPMPGFELTGLSEGVGQAAVAGTNGLETSSGASSSTWAGLSKAIVGYFTATKITIAVIVCAATGVWLWQNAEEPASPVTTQVEGPGSSNTISPENTHAIADTTAISFNVTAGDGLLQESTTANMDQTSQNSLDTPSAAGSGTTQQQPNPGDAIISALSTDQLASGGDRPIGLAPSRGYLVGVGMTELRNYRVADYSDHRQAKWSNVVFSEGHTPANQEHRTKVPVESTKSLSYMQYLDECMHYYDTKQYVQALEGFDALRTLYNDDLNAQFYGAMSRYQLGQYDRAIELFLATESNAMRPLREDAKFYRALSLIELSQLEAGRKLLEEIAAANGFYAKRAIGELAR